MHDQQQYEMKGLTADQPPPPGWAPPPDYTPGPQQPLYPQAHTVVVAPQPMAMNRDENYVEDNMVIAIVSIFFCCCLGLIATFKANNAKNLKFQPGGVEQAKQESATAKKLAIAGIIVGCFCIFLSIFITFILPLILAGVAVAATDTDMDMN